MTHASTFSGIGAPDYAASKLGWENIFHCEINPFGQKILKRHFPNSISYGDISKTDFTKHKGTIDVLSGGFPCQDASIAKQRGQGQQGLQGSRTGLLWEMLRAIREIRPRYVVPENVENLLRTNGGQDFRTILSELAGMGYNAEWRVCRASDVGAPHHRARLYMVAFPKCVRLQKGQTFFSLLRDQASQISWEFAGTTIQTFRGGHWACEPPAICVDDGLSFGLDEFTGSQWRKEQLMAYGNAIVPEIPYRIFKVIEEYEKENRLYRAPDWR
ncbi:DNA (cytosine-5-)-methyltransferase [Pedobacter panaciterrae]|uniref:DNA (cytosine-5-)-methyltransferase n=1 Tax=Pedobacter panaciterrae TaxID=363849 RepID=A0ABU8NSY3_9SPHI